jgi:hypothetical protein
MTTDRLADLLADAFRGEGRLTRGDLHRYATEADAPSELMTLLDALPEGEYSEDEALEALRQVPELTPGTDPDATAP